jgi:hypothetical protein
MARGSQSGILYIPEATWGTTPGTPQMLTLRRTTDSLGLKKSTFQSGELRTDRQIAGFKHGNFNAGGDIGFEWSYDSQQDFMESAFFSAFAITYNLTGKSIAVDQSAKTFTMVAGGFTAAGVEVGDKIVTSGFTETGNNGTFTVTTQTDTVLTCSAATGLVTEAGGGNEAVTTTQKRLKTGVTQKSLSVERQHADITKCMVFTGLVVGGMKLSLKPNAIVTGGFSTVAQDLVVNDAPLDATPTAAPTGMPFDAFTGTITEGGSAIAIATGLELSLENALNPRYVLFDEAPTAIIEGRSNVTGTLTAYFDTETLMEKFINETASSLKLTLLDTAGVGYRITLPRIVYGDAAAPVSGEGDIIVSLPFQAIVDPTTNTNIYIDRLV